MVGCGDSSKKVQPLPNVAFLQGPADLSYMVSPMLGTFTTTGGTTEFATSTVIDKTSKEPITADIFSIILSADRKKAALELYGGLDGNSGQADIWVANSDLSGNPVQITNDAYEDIMPQFSPDGTKIVYASYRPLPGDTGTNCDIADCQWQIVVRNASGSGSELVLPIPWDLWYQMAPTYSPDGTKIAMQGVGYNNNDVPFSGILVTNADGTNPQVLSNPLYSETCYDCQDQLPSYTADGSKIVFSRDNSNASTELTEVEDIYIMNAADGSNPTKLTDSMGLNSDPLTVTVDGMGERILFNSNRDNLNFGTGGGFCIYSIKTDGSGLVRLTNNTLFDGFSMWWYEGPNGGTAAARRANMPTGKHSPPHRTHTPTHGWRQ